MIRTLALIALAALLLAACGRKSPLRTPPPREDVAHVSLAAPAPQAEVR